MVLKQTGFCDYASLSKKEYADGFGYCTGPVKVGKYDGIITIDRKITPIDNKISIVDRQVKIVCFDENDLNVGSIFYASIFKTGDKIKALAPFSHGTVIKNSAIYCEGIFSGVEHVIVRVIGDENPVFHLTFER